jgi:hypothetical protein
MDNTLGYEPGNRSSILLGGTNGVFNVVACILVCETGSTGSIPVRHPNAALADVVIAPV